MFNFQKYLSIYGIGVLGFTTVCPIIINKGIEYDGYSIIGCAAFAVFWPISLPLFALDAITRHK